MQQLKGGDAGDIDWDGNDGPWQPVLFQGAADHVAISAKQEKGRDVSRALGTVLDHLHVEAVIVHCVVRDDHGPSTVLLHHPGLGEEGAAPPLHQSDLILDEETVVELATGLWRFSRDKVNLLIPCVKDTTKVLGRRGCEDVSDVPRTQHLEVQIVMDAEAVGREARGEPEHETTPARGAGDHLQGPAGRRVSSWRRWRGGAELLGMKCNRTDFTT